MKYITPYCTYITEFLHKEMSMLRQYIDDSGSSLEFIKIITNEWMVHFTTPDAAKDITENGFSSGRTEVKGIAFTDGAKLPTNSPGYNYAYLADDCFQYSHMQNYYSPNTGVPLVFKGSGVYVYHKTDKQDQVIFWGDAAKNINVVKEYIDTDGYTWYGYDSMVTNKPLVKFRDMDDALTWIIDNYEQYRKHLH